MSNTFFRSIALDQRSISEAERSVMLSFSSETPYRRWYGDEILLHGEANVNLARLREMGACLFNHDPNRVIGPVAQVRLEGKRGVAILGFDTDALGDLAWAKVKSGSLRGVSVGYAIDEAREVRPGETWENIPGPALIATRWTPYEISLTPVPADATVGVNRSLEAINIINRTRSEHMTKDEIKQIVEERLAELLAQHGERSLPPVATLETGGLSMSLERAQELLTQAGIVSQEMKARVADMIFSGESAERIYREIITSAVKYDARDMAGAGDAPAPKPILSDEEFFRGLKQPATHLL